MDKLWFYKAKLITGVLIIGEGFEINFIGKQEHQKKIHFSKPKRLENPRWMSRDNAIPPTSWEYEVLMELHAKDADSALTIGSHKLESMAARLSFFGVAPVIITSYGGVTDAPKVQKKGEQYTSLIFASEQAFEYEEPPLTISKQDAQNHLANILLPDELVSEGMERIERSMRWLQHSYLMPTSTDEFAHLMLAFEGISSLLKTPSPRYWHCSSCKQDTTACPHCDASTQWSGSGNIAMKKFVIDNLGWSGKKWKNLWKLRNKLFHGTHDLTLNNQQEISKLLPDLEAAVVSAIRFVLNLPQDAPPKTLRSRVPFEGAKIFLQWTTPSE